MAVFPQHLIHSKRPSAGPRFLDGACLLGDPRPRPRLIDRTYRTLVVPGLEVRQIRVRLTGTDEAAKIAASQLNSEQVLGVAVAGQRLK